MPAVRPALNRGDAGEDRRVDANLYHLELSEYGPLVMELELVEPSLVLLQSPPALERLVFGIRRCIR